MWCVTRMCDCKGVGLFQSCPSRGMQPLPVNFTLQRVPTTKWLYFGKMCTLPIDSGLFEAHRTCLGPCKIGQNTHPSYMTFSGNHLLDTNRTCKICACRFSQFAASHANTCAASNIISSLSSATRATSGGMLPAAAMAWRFCGSSAKVARCCTAASFSAWLVSCFAVKMLMAVIISIASHGDGRDLEPQIHDIWTKWSVNPLAMTLHLSSWIWPFGNSKLWHIEFNVRSLLQMMMVRGFVTNDQRMGISAINGNSRILKWRYCTM